MALIAVVQPALADKSPLGARRATECAPAWRVIPSPNLGTDNELAAVDAISPSDAWAVGYYLSEEGTRTLIQHWDGKTWGLVPAPRVGEEDLLLGVSAVSSTDAWAVGVEYSGGSVGALTEHWDGHGWTVVPSILYPNNWLEDVVAVSTDDVWAVGYEDDYLEGYVFPRIIHWDGSSWKVVDSGYGSDYFDTHLWAVSASAPTDAWAVGESGNDAFIEHWDGTAWTGVDGPPSGPDWTVLTDVAAIAADDAWTVGSDSGGMGVSLLEHWDGTRWSRLRRAGLGYLQGITAISADNAWAVGYRWSDPPSLWRTHTQWWDGDSWRPVRSPSRDGVLNVLLDVSHDSKGLWAVGYSGDSTLIERLSLC